MQKHLTTMNLINKNVYIDYLLYLLEYILVTVIDARERLYNIFLPLTFVELMHIINLEHDKSNEMKAQH